MQGFSPYLSAMLFIALLVLSAGVSGENLPADIAAEAEVRSFSSVDNASLSLYAGQNALQQGRFEEALGHYTRATEEDPAFMAAWYLKAYSLARLNRSEEALAAVDQALQLEPGDRDSTGLKADILETLGRTEEASRLRDTVGTVSPAMQNVTPVTPARTEKAPVSLFTGLSAVLVTVYLIRKEE